MTVNRRKKTTPTVLVKHWYIIRKKSRKRCSAYKLSSSERASILNSYEVRGPFKSFLDALIAANK